MTVLCMAGCSSTLVTAVRPDEVPKLEDAPTTIGWTTVRDVEGRAAYVKRPFRIVVHYGPPGRTLAISSPIRAAIREDQLWLRGDSGREWRFELSGIRRIEILQHRGPSAIDGLELSLLLAGLAAALLIAVGSG